MQRGFLTVAPHSYTGDRRRRRKSSDETIPTPRLGGRLSAMVGNPGGLEGGVARVNAKTLSPGDLR